MRWRRRFYERRQKTIRRPELEPRRSSAMTLIASSVMKTLDFLSNLFVFAFFCCVLLALGVFLLDRMQSRDAILRNYPLIGHMRRRARLG
jgi:type II secretory pathway component PulF